MAGKPTPEINPFLHPYMFVLRAGDDIKKDMMDFSLSIWHLTCQERLPRRKSTATPLPKTREQRPRGK